MDYRTRLMDSYFHTQQPQKVRDLLKQTDAHFHKLGWNEGTMRPLAEITLSCELFTESAAYWKEAIAAHEQSQPNRGIGNGTLSSYYSQQGRAFAGLKDFPKAVNAAYSAIVSWGPNQDERRRALDTLKQVIRDCPDLASLTKHWDDEAARTKLENPIVRKVFGQVLLEKNFPAQAVLQLRLALEIQPNDLETHDALIAALDAIGDKPAAVEQLLESLKLNRREIARFKAAGERFTQLENPLDAERAFTSIVESLPLEADSHSLLAEVRESQNRWPDAIAHWQRAAEFRALEPEPLLRLAAAQVHEKQQAEADVTLRKLEAKTWDSRFGDVAGRTRELRQRADASGK